MKKIMTLLVLIVLPSAVPAQPMPEVVSVPRSDCANWPNQERPSDPAPLLLSGISPNFTAETFRTPNGSYSIKPACRPSRGAPYNEVSADVYTRRAVDELFVTNQAFDNRLDRLANDLKTALDTSVFMAAVQEDQVALVSDEVWRRLQLKMAAELKALTQESQALKAEIEKMRKTLEEMGASAKAGN